MNERKIVILDKHIFTGPGGGPGGVNNQVIIIKIFEGKKICFKAVNVVCT